MKVTVQVLYLYLVRVESSVPGTVPVTRAVPVLYLYCTGTVRTVQVQVLYQVPVHGTVLYQVHYVLYTLLRKKEK